MLFVSLTFFLAVSQALEILATLASPWVVEPLEDMKLERNLSAYYCVDGYYVLDSLVAHHVSAAIFKLAPRGLFYQSDCTYSPSSPSTERSFHPDLHFLRPTPAWSSTVLAHDQRFLILVSAINRGLSGRARHALTFFTF